MINKFGAANWQVLAQARTGQLEASWGFKGRGRGIGRGWGPVGGGGGGGGCRSWGLTGLGRWSGTVGTLRNLPVIYVDTPLLPTGHLDPFDPAAQEEFKRNLTAQIGPQVNDSTI